jgi:lipid A 3-O-deacylase
MHVSLLRSLAVLAAASACATSVPAQDLRPAGYFVSGGLGESRSWQATAGVVWPWSWRANLLGTELGGLTEAYISHWSADTGAHGRRGFTQVGVVPLLRVRFAQGRSAWFAEAGIGLSAMDKRFVTDTKQFTTSFNFVDVLGVGRSFGPARQQELSLRVQHASNAGIRVPNPGHNFFQLRYASSF